MQQPEPPDGVTVTPTWILHVDLDQFIAAVEIRRQPELRGRPVVVGGDGNPTRGRQVVATASYEARAFGVHSGMPLTAAKRKCPDAVFLPSDRDAYDEASAEVWGVVRETVARRTGFTCCVGIGDNKVRAKMATGFAKAPAGALPEDAPGVFRLTKTNWLDVMGDRPTDALWGVGAKTSAKLAELGITTVRQVAAADLDVMRARFGPRTGPWFVSLGRGIGDTTVTSVPWVPRGRSREVTLEHDVVEPPDIATILRRIAADVVADVAPSGRAITHVGIKVRFVPFFTTTRVHKLPQHTRDAEVVATTAVSLLDRLELGRPIRLLGVRVELADP